jgi:hypothetical protein
MPIKFLNDVAVDTSVLFADTVNNRVGIGTTSPEKKLHVVGTTKLQGDVGIGTINPVYNLDIQAESPAIRIRDISDVNSFLVGADNNGGYLGMFTNDSLRVYTNSSERMRIDSSGNVGIGTTNPISLGTNITTLDIQGSSGGGLRFGTTGGVEGGVYTISSGTYIGSISNVPLYLTTNNSTKATILANGNVGIGTNSPQSKLHVSSDSDPTIIVGTTTANQANSGKISFRELPSISEFELRYNGSSNRFDIWNSVGGEAISILRSNSNVGIGTTSPSQKLHVSGNARVTGAYYDSNNSPGTSNQVLVSTVTGTDWVDGSAIPGLVDGTGTANYVARWIGTESIGIGVIYDNGTNVGIGTTSPGEKLTLQTQATGLGSEGVFIKNPFAGSTPIVNSKSPFLSLATSNSSGYTSTIYMGRNGTATGQESKIEWSNSNNGLSIYVAGQGSYREHVRFGNLSSSVARTYFNGTVGIGTTSPAYLLDVNEDDNVLAFRVTGGGGGAPIASFVRDVGATGSQVNINAQSNFPQIQFTNTSNTFSIGGDTSGNFKISDNTAIGTNDRITIDNTGNVGIGTTNPLQTLHVNGAMQAGVYYMSGTSTSMANFFSYIDAQSSNGILVRSGSTYKPVFASAFTVSSDYRLKSNIEPLENATSRLKQLEVHRFNWNDRLDEPKVDGFIAHEVAPIIPEAVLGEKDAVHEDGTLKHQGIDQAKLVPLLTAALQEAITKIENLESRIQTLENQ